MNETLNGRERECGGGVKGGGGGGGARVQAFGVLQGAEEELWTEKRRGKRLLGVGCVCVRWWFKTIIKLFVGICV